MPGVCPCAFSHATDAANARSFDGTTSRHIPRCVNVCDGMWSAWLAAGAMRAYVRAAGRARMACSGLSKAWMT